MEAASDVGCHTIHTVLVVVTLRSKNRDNLYIHCHIATEYHLGD
jgi:hypothetical protein